MFGTKLRSHLRMLRGWTPFRVKKNQSAATKPAKKTAEKKPASRRTFWLPKSRRAKQRGRWVRRFAWTGVTLAAMASLSAIILSPPAFMLQAQATTPELPAWMEIKRPIPVYAFSGGPFGREPDIYAARRGRAGSRVDELTFLSEGKSKLWMHVRLHRFMQGRNKTTSFFTEMAQIAAGKRLTVTSSAFPNILVTRFGKFAVADLQLHKKKKIFPCLGYRLEADKPALTIAGIVCGTVSAPVDRRTLACIIDRFDVISARDDRDLLTFVANSELGRQKPCSSRYIVKPGTSGFDWMDDDTPGHAVAALRLRPAEARRKR